MKHLHPFLKKKKVGLLLPLFSMRSVRDWGIGDITSMLGWLDIVNAAGLTVLNILPINEIQPGGNCPYTALSGFAVDPVYLDPEAVAELGEAPDALAFLASEDFKSRLAHLRAPENIPYADIRALKHETLWKIYDAFRSNHLLRGTSEGRAFGDFCARNAYWLDDYALFRRLKDNSHWISWTHWAPELSGHRPDALARIRNENGPEMDFFKYMQWLVQRQWAAARRRASELGISLYGDLPFMVNRESADVWARQEEFDVSASIGAPPDPLTPAGQDWGMPACRWEEAEKNGFEWWRLKLRRAEELYDIYRIDHMVGFFRTWIVPQDKNLKPHFDIEGEAKQEDRGRRFIKALAAASPMLAIGEDLGLIPPYARKVMAATGVPGYKVLRWEKYWEKKGKDYIDTAAYPPASLATTSTHDTEPLAVWWDSAGPAERKLFWKMVSGENSRSDKDKPPAFSNALDRILEKLINSGSRLVIIPFPDLFGLKARINTHNTIGPQNWSFRTDTPLEEFRARHGAVLEKLSRWIGEGKA